MKLFITGPGRHGKDTVAGFVRRRTGLTFESSSHFVARKAVVPYLAKIGIHYRTFDECYADRVNNRMHWRRAIEIYNTPDVTRMSRELFDQYDIYVGIRKRDEFLKAKEFADLSIWVDASIRISKQDPSLDILPGDCDIRIDNNGTLEELEAKVYRLCDTFSNLPSKGELDLCYTDK